MYILLVNILLQGFPGGSVVESPSATAEDTVWVPGP